MFLASGSRHRKGVSTRICWWKEVKIEAWKQPCKCHWRDWGKSHSLNTEVAGFEPDNTKPNCLFKNCSVTLSHCCRWEYQPWAGMGSISSRRSQQIAWVLVATVGEGCYGNRDHHLSHAQIPKQITPPPPPPPAPFLNPQLVLVSKTSLSDR
jgi:hypothetical protein